MTDAEKMYKKLMLNSFYGISTPKGPNFVILPCDYIFYNNKEHKYEFFIKIGTFSYVYKCENIIVKYNILNKNIKLVNESTLSKDFKLLNNNVFYNDINILINDVYKNIKHKTIEEIQMFANNSEVLNKFNL